RRASARGGGARGGVRPRAGGAAGGGRRRTLAAAGARSARGALAGEQEGQEAERAHEREGRDGEQDARVARPRRDGDANTAVDAVELDQVAVAHAGREA